MIALIKFVGAIGNSQLMPLAKMVLRGADNQVALLPADPA
jgi:hypothetical protein